MQQTCAAISFQCLSKVLFFFSSLHVEINVRSSQCNNKKSQLPKISPLNISNALSNRFCRYLLMVHLASSTLLLLWIEETKVELWSSLNSKNIKKCFHSSNFRSYSRALWRVNSRTGKKNVFVKLFPKCIWQSKLVGWILNSFSGGCTCIQYTALSI